MSSDKTGLRGRPSQLEGGFASHVSPCLCSVSCALAFAGSQSPSSIGLDFPSLCRLPQRLWWQLILYIFSEDAQATAAGHWVHGCESLGKLLRQETVGGQDWGRGPWGDLSVEPAWTAALAVAALSGHGMGAGRWACAGRRETPALADVN